MTVQYQRGAELPAFALWLTDSAGALIDFSSGYTFELKLGYSTQTAWLTKTAGIVGAVGSGKAPAGIPNVTVTWSANELDTLPGAYQWQLTATAATLARVFSGPFRVVDVIT